MENETSEAITPDWFLNVKSITAPKPLPGLVELWEDMFPKSLGKWADRPETKDMLFHKSRFSITKPFLDKLLELARAACTDDEAHRQLDEVVEKMDDVILYSVIRVLHLKNHLQELDDEVLKHERPKRLIKKTGEYDILDPKLILQSFLDYLKANGPAKFQTFVNEVSLRLVSTVHPNETERNTNLHHYNLILERFIEWKKDYESLQTLSKDAPEYRIRRESLNQLRRAIKAEIESVWQSDQMRREPITVTSEARRILERYRVIFKAYPMFAKFIKKLSSEAFWLHQASQRCASDPVWAEKFAKVYSNEPDKESREARVHAIKRTFVALNIQLHPPKIHNPMITFGTWKGGDRDGNPFVVASFTNSTFVEQKQFVLEQYVAIAKVLLDELTSSKNFISVSARLEQSLIGDGKTFPYVTHVKPYEPYRAKTRYILEKLRNTLMRVNEVLKQAGETVRPLLSLTLPGPSGFNSTAELQQDVDLLYESLTENGGKSQARSLLQDLQMLINTFGLHMCAIDFRQTSEKNTAAVSEYMAAIELISAPEDFIKLPEADKQKMLLQLIASDYEINPWVIPTLSKISRDTFETLVIYADASRAEMRAIGKFIISMCATTSDILTVLYMMKLVGMLETKHQHVSYCPFDVCGLFETVSDMKSAPRIIRELLSMPLVRDYLVKHRRGRLTVMLGYSDSVRDGSSLAADAQVTRTAWDLRELEAELNRGVDGDRQVRLVFYRGRGDTIPRGFGGSITKALAAQLVTTREEDHTEQNRYLRCYSSMSSALDHLHKVYSAHMSCQITSPPSDAARYQRYMDFFGKISQLAWMRLVSPSSKGFGNTGDLYFSILRKYSILPHLPKSYFASRPVARDGVTYNIDSIRAIPFTMFLSQLREFTSAFYGTGTAFERGAALLADPPGTALHLLRLYVKGLSPDDLSAFRQEILGAPTRRKSMSRSASMLAVADLLMQMTFAPPEQPDDVNKESSLTKLVLRLFAPKNEQEFEDLLTQAQQAGDDDIIAGVARLNDPAVIVEEWSELLLDVLDRRQPLLPLMQEMYQRYPPFRYTIENKETSLLIRNERIVLDYCRDATPEELVLLRATEAEAKLTKKWVLAINKQDHLESKTLKEDFGSPELLLLHKIQAKFLNKFRRKANEKDGDPRTRKQEQTRLAVFVQMSILALSEALGFAG